MFIPYCSFVVIISLQVDYDPSASDLGADFEQFDGLDGHNKRVQDGKKVQSDPAGNTKYLQVG